MDSMGRRSPVLASPLLVVHLAVLVVLCIGAWQIWTAHQGALAAAENETVTLSRSLTQHAARSIETVDIIITGVVERLEAGAPSGSADFKHFLEWRLSKLPQVRGLVVVDATGQWVSDSIAKPHGPINTSDRGYFVWHRGHANRELHIDPPVANRYNGKPVIPVSRRWNKPDGSFGGVVFAALAPEYFENFYKKLGIGTESTITLLSRSGAVLARYPAIAGLIGRDLSDTPLFRTMLPVASAGSYFSTSAIDGVERVAAYGQVEALPLVVYVGTGVAEALAQWQRNAIVEGLVLCIVAVGLSAIGQSINRHQRRTLMAEATVRQSEARYRLLADNTTDMVTQMDATGQRKYVSPGSRDLLGYDPAELTGTRPQEMLHPDDAEGLAALLKTLAAGQCERGVNVNRLRHRDGHWVWVEASLRRLLDDDGHFAGFVASIRDITERKRANEAQQESEKRYRMLAENASDVIMLRELDPKGGRSYVSPAVRTMLGYEPDEFASIPIPDVVHPEDLERVSALYASLSASAPTVLSIHRLRHKDGSYVWVEILFRLVTDPTDTSLRVLGTIRDVTERQRYAQNLEQAKIEAETGARVKAEFLANMSHELRTPLTGILGVHDLLQSDATLTTRQRRFVDLAQSSGRALLTIVNDILDFSKIEAGQMSIEQVPFGLRDLLEDCRQLGAEAIKLKTVDLKSHVAEELPDLFLGDPTRIRQVLLNLITNAIKFTSEGHVTIQAAWTNDLVRLTVSDTGIGIPPEKLPNMFERFSQADGSIARRFGGTGLGLAICKSLVDLMNGQIGVESTPGLGSTFWFDLPLVVAQNTGRANPQRIDLASSVDTAWRVLVAEDNSINQEVISSVLTQKGYIVTMVGDGAGAITAFREAAFDVVLMDVQMPGTDGLAATRAIRDFEQLEQRSATPIIALTANATRDEADLCHRAGMDAHVAKPVKWTDLFSTIERLCSSHPSPVQLLALPDQNPIVGHQVLDEDALEDLAALVGRERIADMLQRFKVEIERRLVLIEAPAATASDISAQAHAIVSMAGQLGFIELSQLCREIEQNPLRKDIVGLRTAVRRAISFATDSNFTSIA